MSLRFLFFALTQRSYNILRGCAFLLHLILFCSGAGFGILRAILYPFASRYFPWQTTPMLRYSSIFVLESAAPFLRFLALTLEIYAWWISLILALLFLLLAAGAALFLPQKLPPEITLETDEKIKAPPCLLPLFKAYLAGILLYGMCETVIGNNATLYLHQSGLGFFGAAWGLALFWGMVTVRKGPASLGGVLLYTRKDLCPPYFPGVW